MGCLTRHGHHYFNAPCRIVYHWLDVLRHIGERQVALVHPCATRDPEVLAATQKVTDIGKGGSTVVLL
jgi:broad specificity phosphatase PhoE